MHSGRRKVEQRRTAGRKLAAPLDPPPYIGFPVRQRTVSEAIGTVNVPVTISRAVNYDITGTLGFGGEATLGVDYTVASAAFTIPAGSTFALVPIVIVQDATTGETGGDTAPGERIKIGLASVSGAISFPGPTNEVPPATPYQILELFILDDDVAATTIVQWEVSGYTVAEGSSYPTLRLRASANAPSDITVDLTVQDLGAELGVDFLLPSGLSYVIPAGQSSVVVPVTIVDDATFEGSHLAILSISALTSAATVAIGGLAAHTITITDDQDIPRVRFPVASWGSVEEGPAGAEFQVTFALVLEDTVQHPGFVVQLAWGGTAVAGVDYIPGPAILQFGPNQQAALLPITVLGDNAVDGNKTVIPSIISVTGGAIGAQVDTTLTIIDDDIPSNNGANVRVHWRFAGGNVGGWMEAPGNFEIEVELNQLHDADVTVTYESYGSEVEGVGILSNPIGATQLTVPAGELRAKRTVLATPFAFDAGMGLIVFNLLSTTVGQLGQNRRLVIRTAGATDVRLGVPQLDTYPGTVDIEVYTDRYEIGGVPTMTNRALEGAVRAAEAIVAVKNPTPRRLLERGVLTVLRVHGDHYAARNGTIFQWQDDTTNPDNAFWTGSRVIRDLLIVGAAGAKIPGIVVRTKVRPSLNAVQITDNVHFANLDIQSRGWKVTDWQPGGGGPDAIHGRVVFYNCKFRFDAALYEPDNASWIHRWFGKVSAEFRDCEFGRAKQHSIYVNDPQHMLVYNCVNDLELATLGMTSGKTFIQVVSREVEAPGTPASGLVAIIGNEITDIGVVEQLGGGDISINGGGEATYLIGGNQHIGAANGGVGARAILVVNTLGTSNPQQLTRSFNFDDTGQRFVTRKIIMLPDETVNCTGSFGRDPVSITGCFDVEIRGFAFTSMAFAGPRITSNSYFSGGGYPNRPGGWRWGPLMGALPASYGGWGALGTGFKMRHGLSATYAQSQNNAVALTDAQINAYNGTNP